MFEQPRRLHYASILIGFGKYVKQAIVPLFGSIYFSVSSKHERSEIIVLITVAVVGALLLIGPILGYFSTSFFIQADSLVIQSGFIWRKRRTIPLARIQNVNIQRTLWHRILGAAAVMVETAAGHGVEGQLDALSVDDANALQKVLLHESEVSQDSEKPTPPPELFSLTPKQVLISGALRNRGMYIIAGIAGASQYENLTQSLAKPVMNEISHLSPVAGFLLTVLLFFGVVLVGWAMSIGYSALRFFGFRIERHEKGLMLTRGLITHIRAIVPLGRVQQVRLVQPMFFRMFDYCEVFAYTAGSFDDKEAAGASNLCPILPIADIETIGKLVFPDFAFFSLSWHRVSPKSIRRAAILSFIAQGIFFGIPLAFWIHWYALLALIPFAIYAYVIAWFRYKYVGYAVNEKYIASRQGVFQKEVALMPIHRIQHYTVRRTFGQRWMGLASMDIFSAASTGAHIVIHDLDYTAAVELQKMISEAYRDRAAMRSGGL